jgi:hypothetical protein
MGHGVQRVFDATIASFATASSEIDLGRSFQVISVEVPAMTSNTASYIQCADTSGGTFRRMAVASVGTSTVAANDIAIASSATNKIVTIPLPIPARYIRIETSAIVSFTAAYKVVCGD